MSICDSISQFNLKLKPETKTDVIEVLNEEGSLFSAQKMPEIMDMRFSVGAILSTPAPYKNSLIFGTSDGYVYAIF